MAIEFDYSKLTGKIVELFGTRYEFAEAIGITPQVLSSKLNGKYPWSQEEIFKACNALGVDAKEYFFTVKAKKS